MNISARQNYAKQQVGFGSTITVTEAILKELNPKKARKVLEYCEKAIIDGKDTFAKITKTKPYVNHIAEKTDLVANVSSEGFNVEVKRSLNILFKLFPVRTIKNMIKQGETEIAKETAFSKLIKDYKSLYKRHIK